jgi:hypothetical protein
MVRLKSAAIDELVRALESSPIARDSKEAAARIADAVPSIPTSDLASIVDTLYALYRVREFRDASPRTFLAELVQGIRSHPESQLTQDEIGLLRERFERLLSIEHLNTLSKAFRLQREGERLYCEAKILSDIRPVFEGGVTSKPENAVITHTLKIHYHEGGDLREVFIVLDKDDLSSLREVVERAQLKDATLRTFLREANLQNLGV